MKQSNRARRIARHQRRMKKASGLNLVSLMDIFTILVFFLMVNSSDVQVLQPNSAIELPISVADQPPRDLLTITISASDILVGGRMVGKVANAITQDELIIHSLKEELDYQASRSFINHSGNALDGSPNGSPNGLPNGSPNGSPKGLPEGLPVMVAADRELPYQLLKRIMSTCVASGFSRISLAVNTQSTDEGV
jgi:biopolymer transport protein TolR